MPKGLAFIQVEKEISEKGNLNKINIIVNSIGVVSRAQVLSHGHVSVKNLTLVSQIHSCDPYFLRVRNPSTQSATRWAI